MFHLTENLDLGVHIGVIRGADYDFDGIKT